MALKKEIEASYATQQIEIHKNWTDFHLRFETLQSEMRTLSNLYFSQAYQVPL